jgi:hypothetical protein
MRDTRPARRPLLAEAFEPRVVLAFFTTTTALVSSANPSAPDDAVTFISTTTAADDFGASVVPPAGGRVEFVVAGKGMSVPSDPSGHATFVTSTLAAGETPVQVVFYGGEVTGPFESDFYGRSEATLTQRVQVPVAPPPAVEPQPPVAPPTLTVPPVVVSPPLVPPPVVVPPVVVSPPTLDVPLPVTPSPVTPPADVPPPAPPVSLPLTAYNRPRLFATGTDAGVPGTAALHNPDGTTRFTVRPLGDGFTGGVRVATGDVTGDGVPDLIAAAGPGGRPVVQVYSGSDGVRVGEFLAFEEGFTGGLYVAAADFDGDGKAEIVVTPDEGGGPRVRVLAGPNGDRTVADFFAIDDPNFRGGARADAGDVTGDRVPDLVVGAGFGGGPRVALFDGAGLGNGGAPPKVVGDFFAFEPELRNGAYVAAGDVTGDGFADLVFGGGPGGGPRVLGLDGRRLVTSGGADKAEVVNRFVADPNLRGGVHVSVSDVNGDGWGDLLVGPGGDGPGVPQTLIGPYLGDPLDFGGPAALGNGVFVGGESMPPGTLLPFLPDDPFYIPDPEAAANRDWMLFDGNSWLGDLDANYVNALLSDPDFADLVGDNSVFLPDYVGVPAASSYGGGTPTTPNQPPAQSSGPQMQAVNRAPTPTIPGGGSNPYPAYPAPTGSAANPQYTQQPATATRTVPTAIANQPSRTVPVKQDPGQAIYGTWNTGVFNANALKPLKDINTTPVYGYIDLYVNIVRGQPDDYLRPLVGNVQVRGFPNGALTVALDPNKSYYIPTTDEFRVEGQSGSGKHVFFEGKLVNGVMKVSFFGNEFRSDPWTMSIPSTTPFVYLKKNWDSTRGDGLVR